MAKIVKLTQSDIENIVTNIIKEGEFDDFDTQIQPEELPDANEPDMGEMLNDIDAEDAVLKNTYGKPGEIAVAKDKNGKYYVADVGTGEILGIK